MQVAIERIADGMLMSLSGEVDADNCSAIGKALADLEDFGASLVVDGRSLTFLDSSGISALLDVRQSLFDRHVGFRMVNVRPTVLRVLEITGLVDLLGVDA